MRLPGEILFQAGDHIFLHFESPQDGYLYIVNEGPNLIDGLPSYNLLFPFGMNDGEPFLTAGQAFQIPESGGFFFDQEEGTEKLWFIWGAEVVPELERLQPSDEGEILDPEHKRVLRKLFARGAVGKNDATRIEDPGYTEVKTSENVLVHLVPLKHF